MSAGRSASICSRFAGRVDTDRVALTGMSFGGFSTAAAMEALDPRVKAAVMQCPSISMSGGGTLHTARNDKSTAVMVMLGTEDTVIGEAGNAAGRAYVDSHDGPAYLVEIVRGGHVSFTSCELYNAEYGNGIGSSCKSLTSPGEMYTPLPIEEQHQAINSYGLAFLNAHLRPDATAPGRAASAEELKLDAEFLRSSHFGNEVIVRSNQ